MKFKVIYDGEGRLRLRCGSAAFTRRQGYGIASIIGRELYVMDVATSPENGGILITYDRPEKKDELLKIVAGIKKSDVIECDPTDNDEIRRVDDKFISKLTTKVIGRFLFTNFMPAPIKIGMSFFRAVSYIKNGIASLARFEITVAVLDAAAITAAIAQGSFSSASSIMFLLSVSDLLEDYTRKRTKSALSSSLAINIDKVWLVAEDGAEVLTPMAKIAEGDRIKVRTGAVIPVDGRVKSGEALVNEASMTGEPLAVRKAAESTVYAGTVVEEGMVVVEVTALSSETRINKIIELIDESESLKAEVQSRAEKLADSIVPFSFLTSLAAYVITRNAAKAMSVLMVDYSCAIKLSTPIAVISAMREASMHRIMVKGGKYLEAFAHADTIVFDKTGTLTEACPKVDVVIPFGGYNEKEVLKTAACLEEHFPHSVARAIVQKAMDEKLNHEEAHAEVEYVVAHGIASYIGDKKAIIGSRHFVEEDEGVIITPDQDEIIAESANGSSVVYLAIGGELAGALCVADPVRSEAAGVINDLKKLGVKNIIMLTGDSENAARSACRNLGITNYRAQVLPEDKAGIVNEIKAEGKSVIMVGDGINDSPALSAANVSVAMKDSSDIAREVADVTLLTASLEELVTLRKLSMKLFNRINTNYAFIISFNTALLAMGLVGIISPQTSAVLHNISTMTISAASMRPCLK